MQTTSTKRFWSAIIAIVGVAIIGLGFILFLRYTAPDSLPVEDPASKNGNMETNSPPQSPPDSSGNVELETPTANAPTETAINISDSSYQPELITVKRGATITWTNQDSAAHTVTAEGSSGPSSGLLAQGDEYSHTFEKVGTFTYRCTQHPEMQGTVQVVE